jgi:hypothetical protein
MPKACSVENCHGKHLARGLCSKHYQRVWSHGSIDSKYRRPAEESFWRRVERGEPDECWEWLGNVTDNYGTLHRHAADGGRIGAHRFSYQIHHGPIPAGMLVMHSCDNPKCVNPNHLKAGTPKENMDDMAAKGRRVTVVPRGQASNLAVLNEHAVRFIRSTDMNNSELGRIFGLTPNAIRAVRIRKSWAHIP